MLLTGFGHPLPSLAAAAAETETTPLDMVIAVDESGSLSPQDVKEEIRAALTIARSGLNTRSRVTVLGFGSDNGNGNERAVTPVCPPTVLDSQVREDSLTECIQKLDRREDAEGNDTDHVMALSHALSVFRTGSPENALKVVFLLTDGALDVSRSPHYGRRADLRNDEAQRQLRTQLGLAAADKVQIWPLGFGSADKTALDGFAAGGSQEACDRRSASKPRARVVSGSREVLRSLHEAYAAAGCQEISPTETGTLSPGDSTTLELTIPPIATDGKIIVSKGDPKVRVDFEDPDGNEVPPSGRIGQTEISRSGENSPVEALKLVNPAAGSWKVKLTAPENLSEQLVSATAIWQGAVQAAITADQTTVRTGQSMTVRLALHTRQGAVTDAESLAGIQFSVIAEGPGLQRQQDIVLRDDGKAPDDQANDGRYVGTFTAPDKPGPITFTGVISGPGIRAERRPLTAQVSAEAPVVQGRIAFDADPVVNPGEQIETTISMENTGEPFDARLVLTGPNRDDVRVTGADFQVPRGESTRKATLVFAENARLGGVGLVAEVADTADLSQVHARNQLVVTLEEPPGVIEAFRWYIFAFLVVSALIAAALLERRRRRRAGIDVRGLEAVLNRDGAPIARKVRVPGRKWADEFGFVIRDEENAPSLDFPRAGDKAYVVRRGGPLGKVVVTSPSGDRYEIRPGSDGERVTLSDGRESDWTLAFLDKRKSARSGPGPKSGSDPDRGKPGGPGNPGGSGNDSTSTDEHNIWL